MAGLLGKIAALARTPAGRRAVRTATTKAQQIAKDPRTRSKVAEAGRRIRGRGRPAPTDPRPLDDGGRARTAEPPGQF